MKLSKSYNKNYSLKEQEGIVERKFNNSIKEEIRFFNTPFIVYSKEDFFYSQITNDEFNHLLDNFKDKKELVFSLLLNKFLKEQEIIIDVSNILTISSNKVKNFIEGKEENISNFSITNSSKSLQLDTSIFGAFLLNKKTSNNFSYIVVLEDYILILYKRSHKSFLFGYKLD